MVESEMIMYQPPATPRFDMTALARSFHCIGQSPFPGLDVPNSSFNFDARLFFTYAAEKLGKMSHSERCVISFLADVWNGNPCKATKGTSTLARQRVMNVPKFDLHDALGCWDASHRAAFIAWAKEPWFP